MTDILEPLLLSDRPVGRADDRLWESRPFRRQLDRVAATFAEPLRRDQPMPSLTVAVLGPWGSGKSSALRILHDLAAAKAPQAGSRLVVCEYSAPVWEATKLDARTTLVSRMLVSLAGGVENAAEQLFLPAKAVMETVSKTAQPSSVEGRLLWSSAAVERIATVLSRLQDFDELLRLQLRVDAPNPSEARAVVVLVDDLDRCEPAFVHELLSETQQLGRVPNVFFVVAADEATLRRAVQGAEGRERTPAEIDHELAKLVQHTITVPDLDEPTATILLRSLLDAQQPPAVAEALLANVGPFLQGLPNRTPRAVKRALNSLGSELAAALAARPLSSIEVQKQLKRMLLARTWEEFYATYFEPLGSSGLGHERQPLVMLQEIVPRLGPGNATDRRILHELQFLCDEFPYLPWRSLPVSLVRFLGAPPFLVDLAPPLPVLATGPMTGRPSHDGAPDAPQPTPASSLPPPLPPQRSSSLPVAPPRSPPPRASFPSGGLESFPVTRGPTAPPTDAKSAPQPSPEAGASPDDFLPPPVDTPSGPDVPPTPDAPPGPPASDPLYPPPIQRALDAALTAVRALPDAMAKLRRAAQAVIELAPEEPSSDAPAMALAHAVLLRFFAHAAAAPTLPRERLFSQLLARHVELLRRHGLHGTAGRILYDAFEAGLPNAASTYAAYLVGAGAMDAARAVSANIHVDYQAHLRDVPGAEGELVPRGAIRDLVTATGASAIAAG